MSDENENKDAEAEAAAKAEAEAKAAAEAAAAESEDTFDKERAMATIRKQREEAKELRAQAKRADELEAELKKIRDAELTEQERLAKELDEARAKAAAVDERLRTANLIAELSKPEYGIVNAKAAARLIEGVEYDDNGEPANIGDIVEAFLDDNSYLRGTAKPKPAPNVNGGDGNQGGGTPALTAEQLEWAAKLGMTPEAYAAFKDTRTVEQMAAARKATTAQ